MKSKEQLLNSYHLNISQLQRLFGLSHTKAKRLYKIANQIDDEELNEYRIEDNKVRIKTALKIMGLSFNDLKRTL